MKRLFILPLVAMMVLGFSACDYKVGPFEANGCTVSGKATTTDSSRIVYSARWDRCDDTYWGRRVCAKVWPQNGSSDPDQYTQICSGNFRYTLSGSTGQADRYCSPSVTYELHVQFMYSRPDAAGQTVTHSTYNIDCTSVALAA